MFVARRLPWGQARGMGSSHFPFFPLCLNADVTFETFSPRILACKICQELKENGDTERTIVFSCHCLYVVVSYNFFLGFGREQDISLTVSLD